MPWSGGSFSRTNGSNTGTTVWQQDEAGAVDIEADRHDTHDQDLADGINACLAKDGSNAMTGNLDLNGNTLDNASAPVNLTETDAVDLSDAGNALSVGGATSSAHLAMSAAIVQAKSDATTAASLSVNSLGGDLNLGPQSGTGSTTLYDDGTARVSTTGTGAAVNGMLSIGDGTELTISSGAVTATQGYHTIDTESDASTDDLDTINFSNAIGSILVISAADNGRTIVCKDGTGNLRLNGDFSLNNAQDTLMLLRVSGAWLEISRSDNAT